MSTPIATFEKISFDQWMKDQRAQNIAYPDPLEGVKVLEAQKKLYENIKLPTRATEGSAGYDFYMPFGTAFDTEVSVIVPTGIRVKIEPGWMLALFPRSGLGFKHGMHLKNTVGIIDSDYYSAANEGHIMAKIDVDMNFVCNEGERFIQGVFIPYGIATNDEPAQANRVGGFGSTGA